VIDLGTYHFTGMSDWCVEILLEAWHYDVYPAWRLWWS
jgi:hypothetical protein